MKASNKCSMDEKFEELLQEIVQRTKCPRTELKNLKKSLSRFTSTFKYKWAEAYRMESRFLDKNKTWLDGIENFKSFDDTSAPILKAGRPEIIFGECSERTKRSKTQELRSLYGSDELGYATQMKLRSSGQVEASQLMKELISGSPTRAKKYKDAMINVEKKKVFRMPGEEALAMMIDTKLTRHQYNIIRSKDKSRFPSYKIIQKTKAECYPSSEHIVVTSSFAEIKLQALLDHTVARLLFLQRDVLKNLNLENQQLQMISKWGFDGSSGISEFKQKVDDEQLTDASIFMISLVPIKVACCNEENKIVWQNPRTSSTRFCRPIKFHFEHESNAVIEAENAIIQRQIDELRPSFFDLDGFKLQVNHKLVLTMVDGKVCNALTETTSTQRCYLCGLTSKDFNNLDLVYNAKINLSHLEFGLSILHGWIRFFECLLHLSYKLPSKKWQARDEETKKIVATRKANIQKRFKAELGLIVDKPKPGFGSSNDGNTARRFFENHELSAAITGIDVEIIKRFDTIMRVIASGYKINIHKFQRFAKDTAEAYVKRYAWYPMSPSVHKILVHGHEVINHALLPIGQLSEEAQEARNKDFKMFRDRFSRKSSRYNSNQDVLNFLLISSDPIISSYRMLPSKKLKSLSRDVLEMLESPQIHISLDTSSLEKSSSNEELSSSSDEF